MMNSMVIHKLPTAMHIPVVCNRFILNHIFFITEHRGSARRVLNHDQSCRSGHAGRGVRSNVEVKHVVILRIIKDSGSSGKCHAHRYTEI